MSTEELNQTAVIGSFEDTTEGDNPNVLLTCTDNRQTQYHRL